MQYKTMILELLQQQPEIHDRLRKERKLQAAMERYATELKATHRAWATFLFQIRPHGNKTLLISEALEFALSEMEDRFSASLRQENRHQFLDAAKLFIRKPHTPRA